MPRCWRRQWITRSQRSGPTALLKFDRGIVIAVITIFVASCLAAFAGTFAEGPSGALTEALITSADQLCLALLSGMTAGAVTGGLLELFELAWFDRGSVKTRTPVFSTDQQPWLLAPSGYPLAGASRDGTHAQA